MQKAVLADWKYPASDASGFNRQNLLIARQLLIQADYKIKEGSYIRPKANLYKLSFSFSKMGNKEH